jgi:hypothetical protein
MRKDQSYLRMIHASKETIEHERGKNVEGSIYSCNHRFLLLNQCIDHTNDDKNSHRRCIKRYARNIHISYEP